MGTLSSPIGRVSRNKYLINFLKILLWILLLLIIVGILLSILKPGLIYSIVALYGVMGVFAYLIFCNVTKRLHDFGKSGWFSIIVLLGTQLTLSLGMVSISVKPIESILGYIGMPIDLASNINLLFTICGFILCIFLLFKKGDIGENRYGKDPLDITNDISEEQKNKIIEDYAKEKSEISQ